MTRYLRIRLIFCTYIFLLLITPIRNVNINFERIKNSTHSISSNKYYSEVLQKLQQQQLGYKFDNFVIYNTHQTASTTLSNLLAEEVQYSFARPVKIYSGNDSNHLADNYMNSNLLAIVVLSDALPNNLSDQYDECLMSVAITLENIRISKIVIIMDSNLTEPMQSAEIQVRKIFYWAWKHQFINLVVVVQHKDSLKVLGYNPFPSEIVVHEIATTQDWFHNKLGDLHGYTLYTPTKNKPPMNFVYTDKSGVKHWSGYYYIFRTFVEHINATAVDIESTGRDEAQFADLIEFNLREYRISVHSYGNFTYPHMMNDWCFMLPLRNEISASLYFLLPFPYEVWIIILFSLMIDISFDYVIEMYTVGRIDVSLSLILSFSSLLSHSTHYKKSHIFNVNCKRTLYIIWGFFITNYYLALLFKVIAVPKYPDQINSWSDLIDSRLKVMMNYKHAKETKESGVPRSVHKIIYATDDDNYNEHRNRMNTSFGYLAIPFMAEFVLETAQDPKQPIFRLSDICYSTRLYAFFLKTGSIFRELYKYHLMQCQAGGLMQHWRTHTAFDAKNAGYQVAKRQYQDDKVLMKFKHFMFPILILGIGLLLATIAFFYELGVAKICCSRL